jgi:hypothetical protein
LSARKVDEADSVIAFFDDYQRFGVGRGDKKDERQQ